MYISEYLYSASSKNITFLKKKESQSSTLGTSFVLLVFQCEKLFSQQHNKNKLNCFIYAKTLHDFIFYNSENN